MLGGDLYELRTGENQIEPKLHPVSVSKILYNYHQDDVPKSAVIYVVTKRGFGDFLNKMLDIERAIEEDLKFKVRNQESSGK